MMTADPRSEPSEGRESVDELAEEAKDENPDTTTSRETFELELMEEGRSEEGSEIQLNEGRDA